MRQPQRIAAAVDGIGLVFGIAEIVIFANFGQGIVFVVLASAAFARIVIIC